MLYTVVIFVACVTAVCSEQDSCLRSGNSDIEDDCEFRKDLTEMIKHNILERLGMKESPKVSGKNIFLPNELLTKYLERIYGAQVSYEESWNNGFHAVIKELFIFPDNGSDPVCQAEDQATRCLVFQLPTKVMPETIESVILQIYMVNSSQNGILTVSEIISDVPDYVRKNVLATLSSFNTSDWVKINVSMLAKTWYRRHRPIFIVEISCVGCYPDLTSLVNLENKPFIHVTVDPELSVKRPKRAIKCEDGTRTCCLQPFRLSFKEIGWDDWVLQPKSFDASYCRGACSDDPETATGQYSMIKGFIREKGENVTSELCCVPRKLKGLHMVHYNSENLMTRSLMPNLIVESCDCL